MTRTGALAQLLLPLVIGACAKSRMTSMAAPDLGERTFSRLLVIANIGDLGLRQEAENAFAGAPSAMNHRADGALRPMVCDPTCRYSDSDSSLTPTAFLPAYTVLFPGRAYSQTEIDSVLTANRIDGVLVLTPTAAGTAETYVPPSYSTTCTTWNLNGGCVQTTTTEKGGISIAKPWAAFTARVSDVRSGKVVWVSTSRTGGSSFVLSSTLVKSMTDETLNHLRADRVVR